MLPDGTAECWGDDLVGQLGNGTTGASSTPVVVSNLHGVTLISTVASHTCALLSGGAVECWGDNGSGELGDGTTTSSSTPVAVANLTGATAIATGASHTCALLATGTVQCWGSNSVGELGNGTTTSSSAPVTVANLTGVTAIAAGGLDKGHTCALLSDGTVQCWGSNAYGALGDGTTTDSPLPVAVANLGGVTAISAGGYHTCALLASGTARCWGLNGFGELGNGQIGSGGTVGSSIPVAVANLSGVTAISAGAYHTCALLSDHTVACWGDNSFGDIGSVNADGNPGIATEASTPIVVPNLSGVTAISAGWGHTCALLSDGSVWSWGWDGYGELGNGVMTSALTPVPVPTLSGVAALSAGALHTCALLSGGSVQCWGYNLDGELGDGTTTDSSTPVAVPNLSGVTAISASELHSCALLSDQTVKCWGDNEWGQLGNATTTVSATPIPVPNLGGVTAIAAGGGSFSDRTCALLSDSTVVCWGRNVYGELGNGTTTNSSFPVAVPNLSGVVQIALGGLHTCALLSDGTVQCWGYNGSGELGDGTTTNSTTPVAVPNLSGVTQIALGAFYTCALLSDGSVKCWGDDYFDEVGNGTTTSTPLLFFDLPPVAFAIPVPTTVAGLNGVTAVAASINGDHTCALLSGGTAVCWGLDSSGEVGNGTVTISTVPVAVSNLSGATAISLGESHSCALLSDGTLDCWGDNEYGQLGNGVSPGSSTPVELVCQTAVTGQACTSGAECSSGNCVDGVCCSTACGGGDPSDCQACSVAAGGTSDGTCVALSTAHACRPSTGICDVSEFCDGSLPACPADGFAPAATVCQAPTSLCTLPALCSGGGPVCPAPASLSGCTQVSLAACTSSCTSETVNLDGGISTVGGVTVTFTGVTSPGEIAVVAMGTGPAPPTGYRIIGSGVPHYWDINTTAPYTGSIKVCFHYDQSWVTSSTESSLRLVHDDGVNICGGSPFCNVTISLDTTNNVICGTTTSLSPFAIIEPIDAIAPVFSGVPGTVVAYATSISGAKVNYTRPTATDAVDGLRPVTCTPASGSMFAPGKTVVTCTASDTQGNSATAAFTVWVQYQAPGDGTFFLLPIRSNGNSIFPVGPLPVPVRFRLTGASAGITNLVAKFAVTKISSAILGTGNDISNETVADIGSAFIYRPLLRWYAYRWKTSGQTQGTYQLHADLGDGVIHQINVSLKTTK